MVHKKSTPRDPSQNYNIVIISTTHRLSTFAHACGVGGLVDFGEPPFSARCPLLSGDVRSTYEITVCNMG